MTFCVVTATSRAFLPIAALTDKTEYCNRHGYTLHREFCEPDAGFDRADLLRALAFTGRYDWLWWVGSDVLITNPEITLESLVEQPKSIVIACDVNEWNADSWLINAASREGFSFLYQLSQKRSTMENAQWGWQAAMISLRDEFKNDILELPQWRMNSYHYPLYDLPETTTDLRGHRGQWQPGDFVFHAAGLTLGGKAQAIRDHLS